MKTLAHYQNSSKVDAVLYAHDDLIINTTELSQGSYPFPTDAVIGNTKIMLRDEHSYSDIRATKGEDRAMANKVSYRFWPNGTMANLDKTYFTTNFPDLYRNMSMPWGEALRRSPQQMNLAKDPASAKYRENDGSILFPSYTQADFLFVPTKHSREFIDAAALHLKHSVWLEVAMGKIVDMVRQETNFTIQTRVVGLCTSWGGRRGKEAMLDVCRGGMKGTPIGTAHPFKLNSVGYALFDKLFDEMQ